MVPLMSVQNVKKKDKFGGQNNLKKYAYKETYPNDPEVDQ